MPYVNYIGKNIKTYEVSQHQHDFWELIYCTDGEGVITFEKGDTLEYRQNQIVLIPPDTLHSNFSQIGFKNIHMTVANWTYPYKSAVIIDDNPQKDLLALFKMCYRYFNDEPSAKSDVLYSLTDLILSLTRSFGGDLHMSKNVEAISEAIVENFSDAEFNLDEVYARFDLSKDYIRRQFIKEKGLSPLRFLNCTRINFAQKLLLTKNINDYKIYEIAEMCGFNDQLYFSRVFKKVTGMSPKEYVEIPRNTRYNK